MASDLSTQSALQSLRNEQRNLSRLVADLQDQAQTTAAMMAETGQTLLIVMERLRLLEERLQGE